MSHSARKQFALSSIVPSGASNPFEGISEIMNSTSESFGNLVTENLKHEDDPGSCEVLRDATDGHDSLSTSSIKSRGERSDDNELSELEKLKAELSFVVCQNKERRTNIVVGRPQAVSTPVVPCNSPVDGSLLEQNVRFCSSFSSADFSLNLKPEQPVLEFTYVSPHPLASDSLGEEEMYNDGELTNERENNDNTVACVDKTGDRSEAGERKTIHHKLFEQAMIDNDEPSEIESIDHSDGCEEETSYHSDGCEEETSYHSDGCEEETSYHSDGCEEETNNHSGGCEEETSYHCGGREEETSYHSGGCEEVSYHRDGFEYEIKNSLDECDANANIQDQSIACLKKTKTNEQMRDSQGFDTEIRDRIQGREEEKSYQSGCLMMKSNLLDDHYKENLGLDKGFIDESVNRAVRYNEKMIGNHERGVLEFGVIVTHDKEKEDNSCEFPEKQTSVIDGLSEETMSARSYEDKAHVSVELVETQTYFSKCKASTGSVHLEKMVLGETLESLVESFKAQTDAVLADSEDKLDKFTSSLAELDSILASFTLDKMTIESLVSNYVLPGPLIPTFHSTLGCKTIASSNPPGVVVATTSKEKTRTRDHVHESQGFQSKPSDAIDASPALTVQGPLPPPAILVQPPTNDAKASVETFKEVPSYNCSGAHKELRKSELLELSAPDVESILRSSSVTTNENLSSALLKHQTPDLIGGYLFVDSMQYEESPDLGSYRKEKVKLGNSESNGDGARNEIHISVAPWCKITNPNGNSNLEDLKGTNKSGLEVTNANLFQRPSTSIHTLCLDSKLHPDVPDNGLKTPKPAASSSTSSGTSEHVGFALVAYENMKQPPAINSFFSDNTELQSSSSSPPVVTCESEVTLYHEAINSVSMPLPRKDGRDEFDVADVEDFLLHRTSLKRSSTPPSGRVPTLDLSCIDEMKVNECPEFISSVADDISCDICSFNNVRNRSLPASAMVQDSDAENPTSTPELKYEHPSVESELHNCPRSSSKREGSVNSSSSELLNSNEKHAPHSLTLPSHECEIGQQNRVELGSETPWFSEFVDSAHTVSRASANLNTVALTPQSETEEATESTGFHHLESLQAILLSTSPKPMVSSQADVTISADSTGKNVSCGGGLLIKRCLDACAQLRSGNHRPRKLVKDFQTVTLQQLVQLAEFKEDLVLDFEELVAENASLKSIVERVIQVNESVDDVLRKIGEENKSVKNFLRAIRVKSESLKLAESDPPPVHKNNAMKDFTEEVREGSMSKKSLENDNATEVSSLKALFDSLRAENDSLQHQVTEMKLKLSGFEELKTKYMNLVAQESDLSSVNNHQTESHRGEFANRDFDGLNDGRNFIEANMKCLLQKYSANRATMDKLRDQVSSLLLVLHEAPGRFNYELFERKFLHLWETCSLGSLVDGSPTSSQRYATAEYPTKIIGKSLVFHPGRRESTIFYVMDKSLMGRGGISPQVASEMYRLRGGHANEIFFRTRYVQTDSTVSTKDRFVQTEEEMCPVLVDEEEAACQSTGCVTCENNVGQPMIRNYSLADFNPGDTVANLSMEATVKDLDDSVPLVHSSWEEQKTSEGNSVCLPVGVCQMQDQAAKNEDGHVCQDISANKSVPVSFYRKNVRARCSSTFLIGYSCDERDCSKLQEQGDVMLDNLTAVKEPFASLQELTSQSGEMLKRHFDPTSPDHFNTVRTKSVTIPCTVDEEFAPAVEKQGLHSVDCSASELFSNGFMSVNQTSASSSEISTFTGEKSTWSSNVTVVDDLFRGEMIPWYEKSRCSNACVEDDFMNTVHSRHGTPSSLQGSCALDKINSSQYVDAEGCASSSSEEETSFGRGFPSPNELLKTSERKSSVFRACSSEERYPGMASSLVFTQPSTKIDFVQRDGHASIHNCGTPDRVLKATRFRVPTPYPKLVSLHHPETAVSSVIVSETMAHSEFELSDGISSVHNVDQFRVREGGNRASRNFPSELDSMVTQSVANGTCVRGIGALMTNALCETRSPRQVQTNVDCEIASALPVETSSQEKALNTSREVISGKSSHSLGRSEFYVEADTDKKAFLSRRPRLISPDNLSQRINPNDPQEAAARLPGGVRRGAALSQKTGEDSELKRYLLQLFPSINRPQLEKCLAEVRFGCEEDKLVRLRFREVAALFREKLCLFKGSDESSCCMICGSVYGSKKSTVLKCFHVFHVRCLKSWSQVDKSCPLCHCRLEQIKEFK